MVQSAVEKEASVLEMLAYLFTLSHLLGNLATVVAVATFEGPQRALSCLLPGHVLQVNGIVVSAVPQNSRRHLGHALFACLRIFTDENGKKPSFANLLFVLL
jgi:hypothetical protein